MPNGSRGADCSFPDNDAKARAVDSPFELAVIVDDDPDIRDTVRRILVANGYAVDSYQTMNDFMTSLWNSTTPPDLAILDVMVETMDVGLEAFVEIRKRFPKLHIIFMTSLGEEIRPYFTGLSDEWILIVEKPVEPVSFLSIIRSRLDNPMT